LPLPGKYSILRQFMKPLALRIPLLIISVAATISGFVLLLVKASSHALILILAAALFLFGSWGSIILVDSLFSGSKTL
jgi:hypothetical protein